MFESEFHECTITEIMLPEKISIKSNFLEIGQCASWASSMCFLITLIPYLRHTTIRIISSGPHRMYKNMFTCVIPFARGWNSVVHMFFAQWLHFELLN